MPARRADRQGRRLRARSARRSGRGRPSVDDCVAAARERAAEAGMAFVHPFDDPDVVAGQGTLGLELLEDVPGPREGRRARSAAAGWPAASRSRSSRRGPRSRSSACRSRRSRPYPASLRARRAGGRRRRPDDRRRHRGQAARRADAAARARRGSTTSSSCPRTTSPRRWCCCMERAKLVVEGAGAVGVAALLRRPGRPPRRAGRPCVVLSGGNVDAGLLASVARRHETEAGRRLVLFTRVPDRPGALARLLALVGEAGANLVDVEHLREGVDLHVRETGGPARPRDARPRARRRRSLDAVRGRGYEASVVHGSGGRGSRYAQRRPAPTAASRRRR